MSFFHRAKFVFYNSIFYDAILAFRQEKAYIVWKFLGTSNTRKLTPHRVKQKAIIEYSKLFSLTTLVESGTCLGEMVNAVKRHFRTIYSIELDKDLYQRVKSKFARFKHIFILNGDSVKALPEILEKIHTMWLFWMDAYYSGGITTKGDLQTPIVQELRLIINHPLALQNVILIDDARCFVGANDYPSIQQIKDFIEKQGFSLAVEVKESIIRIHRKFNGDANS